LPKSRRSRARCPRCRVAAAVWISKKVPLPSLSRKRERVWQREMRRPGSNSGPFAFSALHDAALHTRTRARYKPAWQKPKPVQAAGTKFPVTAGSARNAARSRPWTVPPADTPMRRARGFVRSAATSSARPPLRRLGLPCRLRHHPRLPRPEHRSRPNAASLR
jgi:hypothetical protein